MYRIKLLTLILAQFLLTATGAAQQSPPLPLAPITKDQAAKSTFTPVKATEYIIQIIEKENLWRDSNDTLRLSLRRLVEHFNEPFDSIDSRLRHFQFGAIEVNSGQLVRYDTLPLRWLNQNVFIIDTVPLDKEPFVIRQTIVLRAIDPITQPNLNMFPDARFKLDSLLQVRDTITEIIIDTRYLELKNARWFRYENGRISPPVLPRNSRKAYRISPDGLKMIISESVPAFYGGADTPFYIIPGQQMPDSLRRAVETLLSYTQRRDSVLVHLSSTDGHRMPFWLSTGKDDLVRHWVRNSKNDSVTVWVGNPAKNDIRLILEDEIYVERLERRTSDDIQIARVGPVRTLATAKPLTEIPIYWNYGLVNSFSLNQNFLSNWARGGESSLSGLLDITARAVYTNRAKNEQWTNNMRIRFGAIGNIEPGFEIKNIRTNTDILEINSQYNKRLRNKFDFSSSLYFKTQLAKGFRASNLTVPVSKFLSPGTFTVGVGVEYRPNDRTQFNFSPLSYRNTFVLDTALINQTMYGIDKDKRLKQEMGAQLVFRNRTNIGENLRVTNAIRLFSSYLDKPQNVDVDWELSLERQISYLFSIRINMHLIYDDDIRFPLLDDGGQPVLLPDGSQKRVPRTQLNQFLGLTFSFRL